MNMARNDAQQLMRKGQRQEGQVQIQDGGLRVGGDARLQPKVWMAWHLCIVWNNAPPRTGSSAYADRAMMPALIEAHSHQMEGSLRAYTYVGFFDRMCLEGAMQQGCKTLEEVMTKIKAA